MPRRAIRLGAEPPPIRPGTAGANRRDSHRFRSDAFQWQRCTLAIHRYPRPCRGPSPGPAARFGDWRSPAPRRSPRRTFQSLSCPSRTTGAASRLGLPARPPAAWRTSSSSSHNRRSIALSSGQSGTPASFSARHFRTVWAWSCASSDKAASNSGSVRPAEAIIAARRRSGWSAQHQPDQEARLHRVGAESADQLEEGLGVTRACLLDQFDKGGIHNGLYYPQWRCGAFYNPRCHVCPLCPSTSVA